MAQNLQLDPKKRDYVVVDGSPIPSDRVLEAAFYALMIPKGRWIYGQPDQGSLLFLLNNVRRGRAVEQNFSAYAKEAIQKQLIDTGKASAVEVTNLATSRTGTTNNIAVTPNQTQLSTLLDFVSV